MNALECLNTPFCARLALSLAHFLWEGAVIALAAWGVAAALRRHSSRARYGVYCLALGAMVCALAGTILLVEPPRSRNAAAPWISRRAPALPAFTGAPSEERVLPPGRFAGPQNVLPVENTGVSPQGAGATTKSRWESISAPLTRWWGTAWPVCAPYVSGAYLAGLLAMMLRLVAGLGGSGRLRRLSQPVDDASILQSLARQAQALGLHFTPPIAFCRRTVVPTVVGILRPTILLPFTFATGLSADQIEMLLAHELAHVRRWDPLVNVAQRLIEALLFFHPAMWFISRRIRIERELCCDDLVVALGGKPLEYASSLVETASRVRPSARPAFLPAEGLNAAASAVQLKSRVKRLLGAPEHEALRISRAWVVLCCIAAVALLAGVLSSGRTPGGEEKPGAESVADFTAAPRASEPPTAAAADVRSGPERLVARSAEGVPSEESRTAFDEILQLRETRDAKYVPALGKILEADIASGRILGFAAAQALFCIGTPEARLALDRCLLTPRYETWLGIKYTTHWNMAEPERSDFIKQYYLRNLSEDLAVELAAAPGRDEEGVLIAFTITLRNTSGKAFRIQEQQVTRLGRILSFQDERGRIAATVEAGSLDLPSRPKWVQLAPGANQQYAMPIHIGPASGRKGSYSGSSPDVELFAETQNVIFDIVRKGRFEIYAMVEAQPPTKAQLEKLDFDNLWTGRAVSKPIEVDISLTPPDPTVTNPDGLDHPTSETANDPVRPAGNKQASATQVPDEIVALSGACFDYLPAHGGQWPESLDALRSSLPVGFPLDKYAYTHPARSWGSLDKEVIAIYPKYDKWPERMFVILSDTRSTEWVFGRQLFLLALNSPDGGFPGSFDAMERCIQRGIARWDFVRAIPAAEALLRMANDDAARGRCQLLLAQAYGVWGVEYRDALARNEARRRIQLAIQLNPSLKQQMDVAHLRAMVHAYRQEKEVINWALADAQKEIKSHPRDAQAHYYLGMLHHVLATNSDFAYTKAEQDEERRLALESMAKAVELDPKRYEYWSYYVSALAYAGQKEEAKKAADRMMKEADLSQEKIPASATCGYEIMSALMEPDEGYAYVRAQAARDPSYAPLQFVAAERYDEKDPVRYKMLTDLAARIASGDLRLPPWQARLELTVLYKLGELHYQAGEIEKALDVYDRITSLSPYYAEVRLNRGVVYMTLARKAGTPEEKARLLEKAKNDFEAQLQYPWHDKVADARQYLDKTVKDLETLRAASPAGLEFLAHIPELRALRLDMTEDDLKAILEKENLRATVSESERTKGERNYHVFAGNGENVIVMFREGKCSGIQRMRPLRQTAADPGRGAEGTLSIEASVTDFGGKTPEECLITFWRAIEPGEADSSSRRGDEEPHIWRDTVTGKAWQPLQHCGGSRGVQENLAAGEYRVTAFWRQGSSAAVGVSGVLRLDGTGEKTKVHLGAETGPSLRVRAVDRATRKRVEYPALQLIRPDGLPVLRWSNDPQGIFPADGSFTFEHLAPGRYTLIAGKRARFQSEPEYIQPEGPLAIDVAQGKNVSVTVEMKEARLSAEEAERRWSWSVVGTVTDENGNPVEGAVIQAGCGAGTLVLTGETKTGKDGKYVLRFGPGMHVLVPKTSQREASLQAATISVSKDGYFERNLYRQGGLTMTDEAPPAGNAGGAQPARVVLPGKPYPLDFVLAPSASVKGRLTDARGRPLAGEWLAIVGKETWPSGSALAGVRTGPDGEFEFRNLPVGYALWFEYSRAESGALTLGETKTPYTIPLKYTAPSPGKKATLEYSEPRNLPGIGIPVRAAPQERVQMEGDFAVGRELALGVGGSAGDKRDVLRLGTIRFDEKDGRIRAMLKGRITSWPMGKWQASVALLDADRKALDEQRAAFENSGVIRTLPLEQDIQHEFDFGPAEKLRQSARTFRVTLEGPEEPGIAWGEVDNRGIGTGLAYELPPRPFKAGERVVLRLFVRNKSRDVRRVEDYVPMTCDCPIVFDSRGNRIMGETPGIGMPVQERTIELQPGEVFLLGTTSFRILSPSSDDSRVPENTCRLAPGQYRVFQEYRFARIDGKATDGTDKSTFRSGVLPLTVEEGSATPSP